jgi:hypothetical protein
MECEEKERKKKRTKLALFILRGWFITNVGTVSESVTGRLICICPWEKFNEHRNSRVEYTVAPVERRRRRGRSRRRRAQLFLFVHPSGGLLSAGWLEEGGDGERESEGVPKEVLEDMYDASGYSSEKE